MPPDDERRDDPAPSDLISSLIRRAARRGRTELTKATDLGRAQLELRQARRDLQDFWVRLGKTAYRLSEAGELDHPALTRARDRIDVLERRIKALERGEAPAEDGDE
jgi:hypothetical protein